MRKFTEQIFMGNSSPQGDGTTDKQIKLLKKLIDKALSNLSGMQQLGHIGCEWTSEDIEKECDKIVRENRDIVRDVAMAITGENIEFAEKEKQSDDFQCSDYAGDDFSDSRREIPEL